MASRVRVFSSWVRLALRRATRRVNHDSFVRSTRVLDAVHVAAVAGAARDADAGWQLHVQVGELADLHRAPVQPRAEDMAAAAAVGRDRMQVVPGDLDAAGERREAEADERGLGGVEVEDLLL